jgi:hypothetical protein
VPIPEDSAGRAVAVRNNAAWCAAVCRSHGLAPQCDATLWWSPRRTPPYYPDAVTLHRDVRPGDLLPRVDASPGCSVKDSFATLDLDGDGFAELLTARWIHRPPERRTPAASALRVAPVRTVDQLAAWQMAWSGGDGAAPDVFRPALLADPAVQVLAVHHPTGPAGGAVLHHGAGAVGLSTVFTVPGHDTGEVWAAVVRAAGIRIPGLAVVGWAADDERDVAAASGFRTVGDLRVWLRPG